MPDLISGRIRAVFRALAPGIVMRQVHALWQAEGFTHAADYPMVAGERESLWAAYEAGVEWTNPDQAARALRVYEVVLAEHLGWNGSRDGLIRALNRDGWKVDEHGRIVPIDESKHPLATLSGLEGLRDAAGIMEALNRASALLDRDPAGVVGAVKELIEATAKTVLEAIGETVAKDEDLTSLIKRTQTALGLSPSSVRDDLDSAGSIKKVLGGLSGIAIGLTELRNSDGSGHGRSRGTRLSPRHARLAVNGARAWCEIVLDTYGDPVAPWRKQAETTE
jgi:hypothetical protein